MIIPKGDKWAVRAVQYRDLEPIHHFIQRLSVSDPSVLQATWYAHLEQIKLHYGLIKVLSLFPNPCQNEFDVYVIEEQHQILGLIKVAPFNISRSTWQVEQVLLHPDLPAPFNLSGVDGIGSQLLRHCLETIWQARTWLLEVNINAQNALSLYRQNGFQPLAQLTYWQLSPQCLDHLAQREPDLPNLLPITNADAYLLYQLDTVAMPPLLRQVFDRHVDDFRATMPQLLVQQMKQRVRQREVVQGYVFEPQRKAAIGQFRLGLNTQGDHQAELTVHPAYTWLYPELLAQMARTVLPQGGDRSLRLVSADYQPEREEYLTQLASVGAQRQEHSLLMSRSVWHKVREAKPLEALQLADMLGWQPANPPIPSRMAWLQHPHPHLGEGEGDRPSQEES